MKAIIEIEVETLGYKKGKGTNLIGRRLTFRGETSIPVLPEVETCIVLTRADDEIIDYRGISDIYFESQSGCLMPVIVLENYCLSYADDDLQSIEDTIKEFKEAFAGLSKASGISFELQVLDTDTDWSISWKKKGEYWHYSP